MQEKVKLSGDLIRSMSAEYNNSPPPPPVTPPKKTPRDYTNPQLGPILEAIEIYEIKTIKHKEQDYEKWNQEKKIANCPRNGSANFGIRKGFNGLVTRIPYYCNHCEGCYEANTLKLKTKVEAITERMAEEKPDGQWRKKVVDNDKEAGSLKKRIERNQDGQHLETVSTDDSGKTEVWTYATDEPGKDEATMKDAYGEVADPTKDIDFKALYSKNRSTGKKLSTGSGFRKSASAPKKTGTERVILPDIMIKDVARIEEAEEIIKNTNFIKKAKDADEAKRLYLYQFQYLIKELKEAGIEIAAIKLNFYNMSKEDILNDWNMNVGYWLSVNDPLLKSNEEKVDTSRLLFPLTTPEPDVETVIQ